MTLAGAGVSLFAASAENVAWFLKRIGKRTIGADKVNQLRHVRFLRDTAGKRGVKLAAFVAQLGAVDRFQVRNGDADRLVEPSDRRRQRDARRARGREADLRRRRGGSGQRNGRREDRNEVCAFLEQARDRGGFRRPVE